MYKKTLIAKLSKGLEGDILSAFVERAEGVEEVEGSSLLESLMALREEVEEKDDTKKKDPKKGSKAADKSDLDDENAEEVWSDEDDLKFVEEAKKKRKKVKEEEDEEWDDEKDQEFPDDEDEEMEESKKKKSMKESVLSSVRELTSETISVEEDVNALFEGETLSEEFKEKATTIFEAAVSARVSEYKELVNEAIDDVVAEEVESVSDELTSKIDKYLDYVVEEWMEKNQIAIEHGIRTDITEGFIAGLKNLFIENYIEVPEGKEDALDATIEEKSKIEEEYEESIKKNIDLGEEIQDLKRGIIISVMSKGLADTEAEKLEELASELSFDGVSEFTKKVSLIKESYFRKGSSVNKFTGGVDTEKVLTEGVSRNVKMDAYVQNIAKYLK